MVRACLIAVVVCSTFAFSQTDPGVRGGTPTAGRPLRGLTPAELAAFQEGARRFNEISSVSGTEPGAAGVGLGPRFNMNSCAGCHAQPSAGGSSPNINPQVAVATQYGATNIVPSFIQINGPARVARFVKNADGTADGGVHDLFVITGRADARACDIAQPDFDTALAEANAVFRIPTPVYGAGLMEAISDAAILANKLANADGKVRFGIAGRENRDAGDGMITRFGWKAQTKSLTVFGGEAYNVEQGVTNDIAPNKLDGTAGCVFNPLPEDVTNFAAATPAAGMSDVTGFAQFMRWLAPPDPQPSQSANRGGNVFAQVGCALCHSPVLQTARNTSPSLNQRPVPLFSDLLLHHMGAGLADGVTQGLAAGDEFRSAPLWGLGQRIYLLHDGRATDLVQAIAAHASEGSEANAVVAAFNNLPPQARQDLLNFLRSL